MKEATRSKAAYIAVLILILAALASACALNGDVQAPEQEPEAEAPGNLVAIYLGNDLYTVVSFDKPDTITVDQGNGKLNEITLTGDSVYMSHSTCDNQDCVKQGEITLENRETRILMDWVICLPNQVTIEFVPGEKE